MGNEENSKVEENSQSGSKQKWLGWVWELGQGGPLEQALKEGSMMAQRTKTPTIRAMKVEK